VGPELPSARFAALEPALRPPGAGVVPPPPPAPATALVRAGSAARQDPVIPPPRPVDLSGAAYRYAYRIQGQPAVIRGMGYNPSYAGLSPDERAARIERDFAAMRDAGVNTVLGWVTAEWDQVLLDQARRHGLRVILPYDLDPRLDYTDPAVRAAVRRDVLGWVDRYRNHPALLMWGPGNEVLHKLVHPSWMKVRGDPLLEARADAFAAFYVELIDAIHSADPHHPVVYRDAEEAYLPRIRDALNASGVHRPWFVYGVNIYTPRLAELVERWPALGLDAPLMISEFAPSGAGPSDRPGGYRDLWRMIRSRPEYVLGGAPYVWLTQGPEEVDRIFGMVDEAGRPVDDSLAAIARLYRAEAAATSAPLALPPCSLPRTTADRDTVESSSGGPAC
jgi:hypothetical protein